MEYYVAYITLNRTRRRTMAIARQKSKYYYGFYGHLLVVFDGVITACTVTPASGDEREALWDLTEGVHGLVMGDKGYISAFLRVELATCRMLGNALLMSRPTL